MARDFSGSGQYATITRHSSFEIQKLTLFAWAYLIPQHSGSNNNEAIFDKPYTSHADPYYSFHLRFIDFASGVTNYHGYFVNSPFSGEDEIASGDVSATVDNKWACLCSTYEGDTDELELYLNGTNIDSNDNLGSVDYYNKPLTIGLFQNISQYFQGYIAYPVIWGVALSSLEISSLNEGVNPFAVNPLNFVIFLTFDGIASPEKDYSNNSNNASITGATKATLDPPVQLLSRWLSMC